MEKMFIPYDLALKLKENGFNEECLGVFEKETNQFKLHVPIKNEQCGGWHSVNQCTAPTYDQTFDWFLDKYALFGTVSGAVVGDHYEGVVYIKGVKGLEYIKQARLTRIFGTHKEAQVACIEKLLEITQK